MKVAMIGHRKINKTPDLVKRLTEVFVNLIENESADTFLFGSKSEFDGLCYKIVSKLKYKYGYIERIWTRAEYEYISEDYLKYILTYYEDTFFPSKVSLMRALSYVKRNEIIIDMCDVLVVYYDENYKLYGKKSGTKSAVEYATRKNKRIINLFI